MNPWCFYDINTGVATVPRCGTGTYLIAAIVTITTGVAGAVINVNVNGSPVFIQPIPASQASTTYNMIHQGHVNEGAQITITATGDGATIESGSVRIVKLY